MFFSANSRVAFLVRTYGLKLGAVVSTFFPLPQGFAKNKILKKPFLAEHAERTETMDIIKVFSAYSSEQRERARDVFRVFAR
jgi:hypothetical protein